MSTLQERIAEIMRTANMSVGEIASIAEVTSSAVTQWKDGPTKTLKTAPAAKLSQRTGFNTMWIATGEGQKKLPTSSANTEPGPDVRGKVPLISWVRAGEWCEAMDPFQPGDAERWMECPVTHSSSTFALRVRGDSMTAPSGANRTYPEGCIIFVDPERRTPVNGDRVVACIEGARDVTFKVYKNEDGRQWLMPLNPLHEPIREPFHILGTVLGKWEDG
ncbi:SOS-response transcriptional repressor LexA [Comamonas sp. BIGb0152]|nr:SOS-response transcriptional repressor LexA [Comamonas sp. BIGb0152]